MAKPEAQVEARFEVNFLDSNHRAIGDPPVQVVAYAPLSFKEIDEEESFKATVLTVSANLVKDVLQMVYTELTEDSWREMQNVLLQVAGNKPNKCVACGGSGISSKGHKCYPCSGTGERNMGA